MKKLLLVLVLLIPTTAFALESHLQKIDDLDSVDWKAKSDSYWESVLSEKQVEVCRESGTERAGSGRYNDFKLPGTYHCSSCGLPLFSSEHKFDSGTGWPSFYQPISKDAVATRPDYLLWVERTEVYCPRCNAHLGHVFDDGPEPTGKRYCMNSVCLIHEADLKKRYPRKSR